MTDQFFGLHQPTVAIACHHLATHVIPGTHHYHLVLVGDAALNKGAYYWLQFKPASDGKTMHICHGTWNVTGDRRLTRRTHQVLSPEELTRLTKYMTTVM